MTPVADDFPAIAARLREIEQERQAAADAADLLADPIVAALIAAIQDAAAGAGQDLEVA